MIRKNLTVSLYAVLGFALAATVTIAQQPKESKPAESKQGKPADSKQAKPADSKEGQPAAGGQGEQKLPAGWTEADMQACVMAGTPGKMHELLAKDAGLWQGKNTMWMGPGSEPYTSDCTATMTSIMDGRFLKCEVAGDLPGMGPFSGFGIYGFDNVSQKFVGSWIDNCGTGVMYGTGELSSDGKIMTWNYTHNCPITKKPTTLREIDTNTGPNSKKLEMFGTDPKSGKEYKMMSIEYTRKP